MVLADVAVDGLGLLGAASLLVLVRLGREGRCRESAGGGESVGVKGILMAARTHTRARLRCL